MPTHPVSKSSLQEWLDYIESIHSKPIDMGLDRVEEVKNRLKLDTSGAVVFTVAGTNGKGSTCAMLESILVQAGYRVGLYTSPHILHFNERARLQGESVADEQLIEAFEHVEAARTQSNEPVSLSYFEFTTLAVLWIFCQQNLEAIVLEVGLGGRLDAVNVFDPDCAICTSVDLDHQAFLGDTREAIGREKAGIFRAGKPAIVSDPSPPQSVIDHANQIGADLWLFARDFNFSGDKQQWAYGGRSIRRAALAYPALRGANQLLNASAALAALESVKDRLPMPAQSIRQGFLLVDWPGRFQVLPGQPTIILDVGHNPHAAAHLRESLDGMGFFPYTHCIFGMLADKDAVGVVNQLKGRVDHWHCVPLEGGRGRDSDSLEQAVRAAGVDAQAFDWESNARALQQGGIPKQVPERSLQKYSSLAQAYKLVTQAAATNDRILVFGSFVLIAEVLKIREENRRASRMRS